MSIPKYPILNYLHSSKLYLISLTEKKTYYYDSNQLRIMTSIINNVSYKSNLCHVKF